MEPAIPHLKTNESKRRGRIFVSVGARLVGLVAAGALIGYGFILKFGLNGWGDLGRKFQELAWIAPDSATRVVLFGATHAPDSADAAGLMGGVMDGAIQLFSAWAFLAAGITLCLTVFSVGGVSVKT